MKTSSLTNILVVKHRAMGDAIIGLSTIQYLKQQYPEAKITYITPKWITPLFNQVKTHADSIEGIKLDSLSDWWNTYMLIHRINPDCIFEMFQSGRTKKFFKFYSAMKGIPYFAHNHHTKQGIVHDQGIIKANIQRDLDGAWTFFSKDDVPNYQNFYPKMILNSKKRDQVIFGVVATRETKIWPLEYYARLSHLIKEDIIIPLSNSKDDQAIKEKLIDLKIRGTFLETSLDKLPNELAGSKLYIGNDTGLKHLAIALGIPSYTLFGPEPPLEWHPYDIKKHPYYFRENLDCRTRTAHYCGLATCPEMICLNQFQPEHLLDDLNKRNMI